jgi:hypothetical protein
LRVPEANDKLLSLFVSGKSGSQVRREITETLEAVWLTAYEEGCARLFERVAPKSEDMKIDLDYGGPRNYTKQQIGGIVACINSPVHVWLRYWPDGRPRCHWWCVVCGKKRRGKFPGH